MKNIVISNLEKCISSANEKIYCFICIENVLPYVLFHYCEYDAQTEEYITNNLPRFIFVINPFNYKSISQYIDYVRSQCCVDDYSNLLKKVNFVVTKKIPAGDLLVMTAENFNNISRGRKKLNKHGNGKVIMFTENTESEFGEVLSSLIKRVINISKNS